MSDLEITKRYGRTLSPSGEPPPDAPSWLDSIDNPYLQGLYAPVSSELSADTLDVVAGELPRDIAGAYFRNGPNPRFVPKTRYHWFDGDGMVHGVWFEDGSARYGSRYVATPALAIEVAEGKSIWPGVLGAFDYSLPLGPIKDTGNTDLVFFGKNLLGLWYESGGAHAIDARTLEARGVEQIAALSGIDVSAHAKVDPRTGDLVFFSFHERPPYLRYGVLSPQLELHHVDIELPGPRHPHDIGITENYSILHDFPIFFDTQLFEKTKRRVPLFHPEVPTRYGVIPRRGTDADVKWFEFEPCYMLHVVNCYEDGDWVVMTGCRTEEPVLRPDPRDGKIAAMLSYLKLKANLYCWRMNMRTGEVSEGDVDDLNAEFPVINLQWTGKKNKYSYHQFMPYEIPATFDALIKYDLDSGAYERFDYGPGIYGSEVAFAPKTNGVDEDDGYLVTFVTDVSDWRSECWLFDAKAIPKGPVTKLSLPGRLPAGFHATWVTQEELQAE